MSELRRSFASFLWPLLRKEKKSSKITKGILHIPYKIFAVCLIKWRIVHFY